MKHPIALIDIPHAYQPQIQDIVADLNRKRAKAKQSPLIANDIDWAYTWAVRIGQGHALDNVYLSLNGSKERRTSLAAITTRGHTGPMSTAKPHPRADLPQVIQDVYAPKPTVDDTYPHIAKFSLSGCAKPVGYATGGYRSKSGVFVHCVSQGQEIGPKGAFEILYKIEGTTAIWSGALVQKARTAYDGVAQGDTFTYRNQKFVRLHDCEIKDLVEGKTFAHTM